MGTGVSPRRIITGNLSMYLYTFKTEYKLSNPLSNLFIGQALDLLVLVS